MKTIYAFDPGQTTGFAEFEVYEDTNTFVVSDCYDIPWESRMEDVDRALKTMTGVVVIERFKLFPHKAVQQIGSSFPSVQMIGIIEALMWARGSDPSTIVYQTPGDIARVMIEEKDIPMVSGSPHKADAYRHARLYYLRHFVIKA